MTVDQCPRCSRSLVGMVELCDCGGCTECCPYLNRSDECSCCGSERYVDPDSGLCWYCQPSRPGDVDHVEPAR